MEKSLERNKSELQEDNIIKDEPLEVGLEKKEPDWKDLHKYKWQVGIKEEEGIVLKEEMKKLPYINVTAKNITAPRRLFSDSLTSVGEKISEISLEKCTAKISKLSVGDRSISKMSSQTEISSSPSASKVFIQREINSSPSASNVSTQTKINSSPSTSNMSTQTETNSSPSTSNVSTQTETNSLPFTSNVSTQTETNSLPFTSNVSTQTETNSSPSTSTTAENCEKTLDENHQSIKLSSPSHHTKKVGHFKCEYCTKQLGTKNKLERHWSCHAKLLPFKCTQCDQQFQAKNILRKHTLIYLPNINCEICEFTCKLRKHLTSHMRRYHPEALPFGCEKCGFRYWDEYNLNRHIVANSKNEEHAKMQKCDMCKIYFKSRSAYKKHIKKQCQALNNL